MADSEEGPKQCTDILARVTPGFEASDRCPNHALGGGTLCMLHAHAATPVPDEKELILAVLEEKRHRTGEGMSEEEIYEAVAVRQTCEEMIRCGQLWGAPGEHGSLRMLSAGVVGPEAALELLSKPQKNEQPQV